MPVESKQWFVEFGIALYFNVTRTVFFSYLTFATKSTYTERQTYLILKRAYKSVRCKNAYFTLFWGIFGCTIWI